jgi:hypothetical protein
MDVPILYIKESFTLHNNLKTGYSYMRCLKMISKRKYRMHKIMGSDKEIVTSV